jgi:hypothetical protein
MNSSSIFTNVFRFISLVLLQVLILKRINIGGEQFNYVSIIIYPLFILLLPLRTPKALVLVLAFALGITIDLFYDSPGVHASALVFMGYIRRFILNRIEPRGGYNPNYSPTKKRMGFSWFLRYAALLMGAFLLFYFSVEIFNFAFLGDILLRTISSFIVSMIFIIIVMFIFDPTD